MTRSMSDAIPGGRVDSLDYLRGIAAFGIMAYHMYLFNFGEADADSVLARIKIFGVAIFYILSGITLYIVYSDRLFFNKRDMLDFYIKRFFRIVPLLWLVTILTLALEHNSIAPSFRKIVFNFMVVPCMVKPESFIANGAWSIGNELFFYLLFPFLIFMARLKKIYVFIAAFLTFLAFCYFTFVVFNPAQPLGYQWADYVNPLNQVFFFIVGICLASLANSKTKYSEWSFVWLFIFMLLVVYYPVQGEPIKLVSGFARIVLSLGIAIICFLVYKSDFSFFPQWVTGIFKFLGEISYSLYLLHPIVFLCFVYAAEALGFQSRFFIITATMMVAIAMSYLSYHFFEKFFIALGKSACKKWAPAR